MAEVLLILLSYGLVAFVGYGIGMLRLLKALGRVHEVWEFELEFIEYPENIHRSKAYKSASDLMLEVTRPPFGGRRA